MKRISAEMMEEIKNSFKSIWTSPKDEDMIAYCLGNVHGAVKLEDGGIYIFNKPCIRKTFCFGYGQNGISTAQERDAAARERDAIKTQKDAFINANMEEFDSRLKFERGGEYYEMNYYGRGDNVIKTIVNAKTIPAWRQVEGRKISDSDIEALIAEYEWQRADFLKRLETYWKRYQGTKLRTWTYLVD